jgi:putative intracellular protease/amidase
VISPRRESIARDNSITGFTTRGEEELGVMDSLESWGRKTIEGMAKDMGAKYVSPPGPWDEFVHTDGRLVTGANPASAGATAKACLAAFQKHEE